MRIRIWKYDSNKDHGNIPAPHCRRGADHSGAECPGAARPGQLVAPCMGAAAHRPGQRPHKQDRADPK